MGETNGHSSESESGPNNDPQYGELTLQTFWPKVTEEIRKINVVCMRYQIFTSFHLVLTSECTIMLSLLVF